MADRDLFGLRSGPSDRFASVLDQIGKKSSSGTLTLESLASDFEYLQRTIEDDYDYTLLCNLSWVVCGYALPLLIEIFRGWNPLQNPTHGVDVVRECKKLLLKRDDSLNCDFSASPYVQLLMGAVIPALRVCVTSSWEVRDPEPMLMFLESWEELLPPPVLEMILDTLIVPKISAAVYSWDPCRETKPIHSWVHPWLPLMGHKLEVNCYRMIRDRLARVPDGWHPSDMSAYHILSPWATVFDPASWEHLMARCITPKLLSAVHDLEITPVANQICDEFYWVRTWVTVIPIHHMLRLMDIFFDKWQQVLYDWLCLKPDFDEVTEWYLGWRQVLPTDLIQANEHIRYRLTVGLEMMNQAVEGMEMAPPQMAHKEAGSYNGIEPERGTCSGVEMSLKEVIEIHAQHSGLVFKPKAERTKDGQQIYAFGNISIIIDPLNEKVFAQIQDKWSLVSLEQLLKLDLPLSKSL